MPTPMDAMLGLVVSAIGVLIFVVAFSVADTKKKMLSYVLASVVTLVGVYYYATSAMRAVEMRQRIATLQKQQQINVQEIQKQLQAAPVKK